MKHLQFVSSVRPLTYWVASALWDISMYMVRTKYLWPHYNLSLYLAILNRIVNLKQPAHENWGNWAYVVLCSKYICCPVNKLLFCLSVSVYCVFVCLSKSDSFCLMGLDFCSEVWQFFFTTFLYSFSMRYMYRFYYYYLWLYLETLLT